VPPYEYRLDAGPYQASGTFSSIAAGTYTVTARDATLTTVIVPVTITEPVAALGGSVVSRTNVLCFGESTGSMTVTGLYGTAPYEYKLGTGSFQSSGTFTSVPAGAHTITIQDANLCTYTMTVTIVQPAAALSGAITNQTNITCYGAANGIVTITGSGGTSPYQYSLNSGTYQISGTFGSLTPGAHTVSIRDANLCTFSVAVMITEPAALALSASSVEASCPGVYDGSIELTITGGTQPYSATWSDGVTTVNRVNIPDGTYSVVVTDKNSCAAALDVVVGVVGSSQCLEFPEVITPNNDGFLDTWQIKNADLFPNAEIQIFTRWGKRVYSSKNLAGNPWDGTDNGKLLPTDSYHYILYLNDGSPARSGVVTIIR
ncbi:MAG: gliding motility-associated C-terminal domain-containing protein, partial [Bacteroidales bacterium]|nr:gliding motility-associated C-terminal domain-containing protein [Bacteroidales bacterium]